LIVFKEPPLFLFALISCRERAHPGWEELLLSLPRQRTLPFSFPFQREWLVQFLSLLSLIEEGREAPPSRLIELTILSRLFSLPNMI